MKRPVLMKRFVLAALVAGLAVTAAPLALAQAGAAKPGVTPGGVVVPGIATVNTQAVVVQSQAYQSAAGLIQTNYKPQLDQAKTRQNQINAQLKPMVDKLQADAKDPKADQAKLEAFYGQIKQIQADGQREIQGILEPIDLAQQFVVEQIGDRLDEATQAAMTKRHVTLVLDTRTVAKSDAAYSLDADVVTELNHVLPSVQVVPPAGWVPRAQRQQAARESQAQGAAPAPAANRGTSGEGR